MASSPNVQVLHDQFSSDPSVSVLAVHWNDRGDAASYLAKHNYTFPTIADGQDVAKAFGVTQIPTFLVVGPNGDILYSHLGRLTDETRDKIAEIARANRM